MDAWDAFLAELAEQPEDPKIVAELERARRVIAGELPRERRAPMVFEPSTKKWIFENE